MQIAPHQVAQIVEIKRGDTSRILYDRLYLGGTPIPLTSASEVNLLIYNPVDDTMVRRATTVTVPESGSVQYQFAAEDISTTGSRIMEFEIVYQNGTELTIPTTQYYVLNIIPDLG